MAEPAARLLDEFLVADARAGGRGALDRLVRRWQPKLVAHAWRLTGDRELARDAAQTGWGEIVRGLGSLRDERAFPAWAYRIVSRACAREIAGAVRRRELASALASEAADAAEPIAPSDAERLQAAIRRLPPGERAAIALHHFEDLRVAEVAVALAVPVGTVKTRLMNARRKLRSILEGEQS